ncbi:XRE family transcriptional regulator [uncultured Lactococcus sp.]|uniref:helix-turn-helix domain-containing protein n=1 Tax=uncultured Lactococcus sp. TaxID=167973 RepID=UPI0020547CD0|nr:XRE family transcriptional regulator [uncultured Lactococcus sp.]DAK67068.1 MAG TPA: IrrE protein [Caudoviricetes sp.]
MEDKFNHKQLTSARLARGMSMKELAEKIGVSRQMVSYYESNKKNPSAETLLKIMLALKFPRSFFSAINDNITGGATFFRKQSSTTKKTRDMQKEHLKYLVGIFYSLSRYVNFPKVNLPELVDKDIFEITDEEIKSKASELRKVWGLDYASPINNLISLAEANGIIVSESTVSDNTLDALSRWIVDRPFIMLTNNQEVNVRRRFNVAHEIGHIILHNSIESIYDYSNVELKNIIEKQANLFASHFLLPDEAFVDSILSTSLEYFVDLKKYWKVSIQAMVYKTHYLGLLNDDRYLYLNKQISTRKWRTREPLDDVMVIERPSLLEKVYKVIIDNNIVTKNELNQSFNLPIDEIKTMIGDIVIPSEPGAPTEPILRLVK